MKPQNIGAGKGLARPHQTSDVSARVSGLLSKLDKVKRTGDGRWVACCPSHKDKSPSLSIREQGDAVLIHCFGGCSAASVLQAVGMDFADIFPPRESASPANRAAFHALDALKCLADDAMLVAIAARMVANGEAVADTDIKALIEASTRANRAYRLCGGRK